MQSTLSLLVLIAALFSLVALVYLVFKAFRFGTPEDYTQASGSAAAGIRYAFIQGMMPWEKESAAAHLPTFLGGILYHASLFSALAALFWLLFRLPLPEWVVVGLRLFWIAGFLVGLALLAKRLLKPELKRISYLDDYIANALVDLFLLLAVIQSFIHSWQSIWFGYAILLFIYIPLGKIRHCFFFFYTRILFGRFFGRRGVFPRTKAEISHD